MKAACYGVFFGGSGWMPQGEVILGRLIAPGVPERNVVFRSGALFAGSDQVSPQRLVSWDRSGHFAWASSNMHDVFYSQHPQVAETPAAATGSEPASVATTPPGRKGVVWLHTALAASSVVIVLLLGVLLGLRALLGRVLPGGGLGVAAVTIAGGLMSAAAFLGGWLLMRQASKRGAPRTVAATPLAFSVIMIASIAVSSPRSSLGGSLLSFGVPVTLASVAMFTGALAADPKAAAGRSIASQLATLGLTLVVAMSCSTLAAAGTPANSEAATGGIFGAQSGSTDGSAATSEDEYRAEAESALPGWKVEQSVPVGAGALCLLGSSSAPTVHLVMALSEHGSTSLDAFRAQPVAVDAFAQAFARKHPGAEWAVSMSGAPMQYRSQGGQSPSYTYVAVGFVPLAAFNSSASSGAPTSDGREEWVLTGTGNSVAWMTSDDPRLGALLQQWAPGGSRSGAYPAYPNYPQAGSYASPQGYAPDGAYRVAP